MHNPALPDTILANDQKFRDLDAELETRLSNSSYRDYLIARALVNELSASYEIELEHLERKDIYAASIDCFQLNVPSKKDIDRRRHNPSWEQRVIEAVRLLLNDDDKMTPDRICQVHQIVRKNDDGKNWGKFRKNEVGVYPKTRIMVT